MLTAVLIVLFLIVLNGVFSMSEVALISSRRARLEPMAEGGGPTAKGAQAALAMRADPNRFLSTVQIGITLIGIFSGAFGEAAIGQRLRVAIASVPALEPHAGLLATGIVVLVLTYLSLVVGELVPKRVGMSAPERIASAVSLPMRAVSVAAAPVVWFLSRSTDLLLLPFRGRLAEEHPVTEEDIRGMLEAAAETGAVHQSEQEIVERVFDVGDLRVRALMVPRPEIEFLDVDETPERIKIAVATAVHSHFPVCRGTLDKLVGIVHLKEIIKLNLLSQELDLEALARPALFVPETMPVLKLLDQFRERDRRIAMVVDEYGGIEGLVTLNDVVNAIIGRTTGDRPAEPLEVRRTENSWLLDGSVAAARLKGLLGELPPAGDYETLAGFVLAVLGHIPKVGERFEAAGHSFEIVDMDGQRIDRVLVVRGMGPMNSEGE